MGQIEIRRGFFRLKLQRFLCKNPLKTVQVTSITNHPEHDKKTNNNDITILRVDPEIRFRKGIKKVTLGSREEFDKIKSQGKVCRIVGHGKLHGDNLAAKLQKSNLMVDQDTADCTEFIPNAKSCFITKGNGKQIQGCNGDSGDLDLRVSR